MERGKISESSADIKVSAEGEVGGASDARAEISLQPMVKRMVGQLCPCSPARSVV